MGPSSTCRRAPLVAMVLAASAARATPIVGEALAAGPLRVYADDRDPRTFYYPPGALAVGDAPDGGPELRFLQLVYVGRPVTGDAEKFLARSVLSFRVVQRPVPAVDLDAARAALPGGARLHALPVRRLETQLVWTPVGADAPGRSLGEGRLEDAEGMTSPGTETWSERQLLITPDPLSSQLLWDALQRGQVAMSFGWSFHATGAPASAGRLTTSGGAVVPPEATRAAEPVERVVASGAFPITVDAARHPDRFRRLDLNAAVPPAFGVLEVRCYDFENGIRPDLARKLVDLRATGVGGHPVSHTVTFKASAAAVVVASARFAQAVRLDRPFRWRTVEIAQDGTETVAPWVERSDWIPILDVTTPGGVRPRPPTKENP